MKRWNEFSIRGGIFCVIICSICSLILSTKAVGEVSSNIIPHLGLEWDVIKDDFLVNDDTLGKCDQTFPNIAGPVNGKFVLAWRDTRDGSDGGDIFAGIYDTSGMIVDSIFRVNDDIGTYSQSDPFVTIDSLGRFVVVWADFRNGLSDIYAQLYNAQGIPMGSNFIVNDDTPGMHSHNEPAVTKSANGFFIVVWRDERDYADRGLDIYAQIYDSLGNKQGTQFIVNDDSSRAWQRSPEITFYSDYEFAVVWMDGRRNEPDIYYQRYNLSGTPIGNNFKVNTDNIVDSQQWFPFIASNHSKTIILWRDNRLAVSYPNIFAQLYDSSFASIDTNFCVNPGRKLSSQGVSKVISCVISKSCEFVVTWSDETVQIQYPEVYFQAFDSVGIPVGSIVKVNEITNERDNSTTPKIIMKEDESFLIAWQQVVNSQSDIIFQLYDNTIIPVGNNVWAVPEQGSSSQIQASATMNNSDGIVITWVEEVGSAIYCKTYDTVGTPYVSGFRVNIDSSKCSSPSVAIDTSNNFIVAWEVDGQHIYGRKYSIPNNPISVPFKIDSGGLEWVQRASPDVSVTDNGNFVVAWEDYRFDNKFPDVFCQRFNKDCVPIDTNFRVDVVESQRSQSPCVSMQWNGQFVVVWAEDLNDKICFDIQGRKYKSTGVPAGMPFTISEDVAGNIQQEEPSMCMDKNGNFIVVWQDFRNNNYDIYGQICDISCELIGPNFKVNDDTDSSSQMHPSVAVNPENSGFIVSWVDYKTPNPQMMAQLFDSTGQPYGTNFQVNNFDAHSSNQHFSTSKHSATMNNELVSFAWTDNRRLKGWDIYAKIIKQVVGIEGKDKNPQTYICISPNPIHNKLIIEYGISIPGEYGITIYDRAGRKVFTIPKQTKSIGRYTTEIDFSKFASGSYFIRLDGPESSVSKLIHIKWK